MINKKHTEGFSLIELMVAMVVGLIIISGAFSLHSTTRKTQVANEAQMDMVADARFAIEMISYDLRHAGMWGGTNRDALIECTTADDNCVLPAVNNECAAGWAYNLAQVVFARDNTEGNPYAGTCIKDAGYQTGTDILEIRYADANPAPVLRAGQAYIRSNFLSGQIFIGTTAPGLVVNDAAATTNNHMLHAFAYYISDFTDENDGIPALRRVALVNGPSVQNQLLVSGVSDLQVQLGVDLDNDQVIDVYVDPSDVAADDWTQVYAAKIWLVMRSDKPQRGVNTSKTFRIAGQSVNLGGENGFRYFMVSSVVSLRNVRQVDEPARQNVGWSEDDH